MASKAVVSTRAEAFRLNILDRLIMMVAPKWGLSRVRARVIARHFEAASVGWRTVGWNRRMTDANAAASGLTLAYLRAQARDLVRNNPWARNGLRTIATDVVGWGIRAKAKGRGADRMAELWRQWAETKQCDSAGELDFYGLQWLVMRTVAESGECLIRRRLRRPEDRLAIPMQLQVLEPDYIDTGRDNTKGPGGGPIVQGVEFDLLGRRVAYWLFDTHPGSGTLVSSISRRIPADGILHVFDKERPGQVRGYSWFASVDVRLHEFDEYEGATLMKQKIAACMAAFVTDVDGGGGSIAEAGEDEATGKPTDSFEPGMINYLPPGKQVTVANPPQATDYAPFSASQLRAVAAGLGITYEALTGDYSQVNYSSARMGRNSYTANVNGWRWKMLIPQFCAPVWQWANDLLILAGEEIENQPAAWTPPPLPMLDPDKESAAISRLIRTGQQTHNEMVREQGLDPDEHWQDFADGLRLLDKYGIVLDSDPRRTNNSGQAQAQPAESSASATKPSSNGVPKNGAKPAASSGSPSA